MALSKEEIRIAKCLGKGMNLTALAKHLDTDYDSARRRLRTLREKLGTPDYPVSTLYVGILGYHLIGGF